MKRTISNYVFNATAKTVTFTDFTTIRLESILLITNTTRNTIIYQLTSTGMGGTVAATVLTLASSTTGQADADKLNIIFEDFISSGFVSTANSTATNLALNAVFTGTSEEVVAYSNIKVSVFASHASATDGLQIQQSSNNVNWDSLDIYSIQATTARSFSVPVNLKFFRIIYTNGATATTELRLQVIFSTQDKQPSSVRPQDGRDNNNDFVETLAALLGYNSLTNAWNRVGIASGNLGGNETLLDRLKVNASLRMLDTAQPSGSQLVGAVGTQALGLLVNTVDRAGRLLGVLSAGANAIGNINELRAATLTVTATAASGVAATLTLPAVAAQFHYITSIAILIYATAARTGAAAPVVVTTTNIAGNPAFTFETAQAIGTNTPVQGYNLATPLKSAVVNTATTIVAPIATAGIWRITITYFTGA